MKALFAVLSYLLGAIPTGYLVFRLTERKDIRQYGSHNIGATNVMTRASPEGQTCPPSLTST